jgi:hypothetical protein
MRVISRDTHTHVTHMLAKEVDRCAHTKKAARRVCVDDGETAFVKVVTDLDYRLKYVLQVRITLSPS